MTLVYGSVCSGIEAATVAWHPLGWRPAFFSEIERFPRAVLQHHYPDVPLHGDFTTIQDGDYERIDLLVGGTPCQSFSVAGKRAGLDDPRGVLALEFIALAQRLESQYIVWENVPGAISSEGGDDLRDILTAFNDAGYAVHCEVLDAQYHGVPQRRRRLFCIGYHVALGRQKRTPYWRHLVGQLLTDSLLSCLIALSAPSSTGWGDWASEKRYSAAGVQARMKLFGLQSPCAEVPDTMSASLRPLLSDWAGVQANSLLAPGSWDSHLETRSAETPPIAATASSPAETESACSPIGASWRIFWDALCNLAKSSTTSTDCGLTIDQRIYSCAQVLLSIAHCIINSLRSEPNLLTEDSSSLTALRRYIDYARRATNPLFEGLDGIPQWGRFIESAESALREIERHCGEWSSSSPLLFERAGLRGDPPPRREAGQDVTGTLGSRATAGGGLGTDLDLAGGIIQSGPAAFGGGAAGAIDVSTTLSATEGRYDFETETFITHALTGNGFDASEDGTGRGTTIIAIDTSNSAGPCPSKETFGTLNLSRQMGIIAVNLRGREGGAMPECDPDGLASLRAADGGSSRSYLAFAQNTRDEVRLQGGDGQIVGALSSQPGMKQTTYLAGPSPLYYSHDYNQDRVYDGAGISEAQTVARRPNFLLGQSVRRLTPRECERLQGFPDDYTAIPYRGKPAESCPDGPRYKSLGNSMAVPVMRWIGERIQLVESLLNSPATETQKRPR